MLDSGPRLALFAIPMFGASALMGALCTLDVVPAATLLLPYFEVDLGDPQGARTTLTITNATELPTLAHATLWTDWGAPSLDFDIFLTGHDVVVLDLRALFTEGRLPVTADEARDPGDLISPHGDHPAWDGSFPGCEFVFPLPDPALNAALLERVVDFHTGQPVSSLGGTCAGEDHGDDVARGYVTLDVATQCSLLFPGDPGYFVEGGGGVASDANLLWGEVELSNPGAGTASRMPLVHVEADPAFAPRSGATFYGRLVGNDGRDDREPLGSVWSARYRDSPSVATEFVVWRDPTDAERLVSPGGVDCATGPAWLPIDEAEVRCFSETSDLDIPCAAGGGACFPLAAQRSATAGLTPSFVAGVCELDLNHLCTSCDPGGNGAEQNVAQAFVASWAVQSPGMSLAADLTTGAVLVSACEDAPPLFGEIFVDGFESGDTSAWTVP